MQVRGKIVDLRRLLRLLLLGLALGDKSADCLDRLVPVVNRDVGHVLALGVARVLAKMHGSSRVTTLCRELVKVSRDVLQNVQPVVDHDVGLNAVTDKLLVLALLDEVDRGERVVSQLTQLVASFSGALLPAVRNHDQRVSLIAELPQRLDAAGYVQKRSFNDRIVLVDICVGTADVAVIDRDDMRHG